MVTNILYYNQEPGPVKKNKSSRAEAGEELVRSISRIVDTKECSDEEEGEGSEDQNYQPNFSLVHSNVLFISSLVSTSLLIGMDILYSLRDKKKEPPIRNLTYVVVLFCLIQILIWIDLNKSRRGPPSFIIVEQSSMFREILLDLVDPIISLLMAPFIKLAKSVHVKQSESPGPATVTTETELTEIVRFDSSSLGSEAETTDLVITREICQTKAGRFLSQ